MLVQGDDEVSEGYQLPSSSIVELLDAPVPPMYNFSPDRTKVLKVQRPPVHPPITEFMREELKLAGLRIDPELNARSRMGHSIAVELLHFDSASVDCFISDLPATPLQGVPEGHIFNYVRWAPDSARIAFTLRSAGGVSDPPRGALELWVADTGDMTARQLLGGARLNAIFEDYLWLDGDTIVASVLPPTRGDKPAAPAIPHGPKVSDNSQGRTSKARTYPDLLQNAYDEDLFEWLCTSELVIADVGAGTSKTLGPPRMYVGCYASPNSEFMLVSWIERPFSYQLPVGRFPRVWQIWDRTGAVVHEVCRLGLLEEIPIEFDATRTGPRSMSWRADAPATLTWAEALDGGDPKNTPDVVPRDAIFAMDFTADAPEATRIATTDLRYGGIAWCDDSLALLYESWWETRTSRVWLLSPGDASAAPRLLLDRNYEDIYNDPGAPVYIRHPTLPTSVLARVDGEDKLLMSGEGASPEGNRPFLDVFDLSTGDKQRIWQSEAPFYEGAVGTILNEGRTRSISLDDLQMLFSRETKKDPPQFFIKSFTEGGQQWSQRQITNEPHPFPSLRDLSKEILQYSRADGVALNAELYLPPGYSSERDGRLPCILWAYPREYKSKDAAGQLDKSPYEFSGIAASSPLVWLAKGFAVLSGPSMPIVAEGDEEPNDTYVEQLVASAKAAVDAVVEKGVVDPSRVAAGGHSYGAFMVANMLAHCGDLFACGIAQSGAYNRTLTPFGFQSEQRTFWDAPEVYNTMAPFNQAHKIRKPLLLIHGEADNNTGTFPMQSERMFAALKGHGCVTKLVVLPFESHGYRAYESVMHVLHENEKWLDLHCSQPTSST